MFAGTYGTVNVRAPASNVYGPAAYTLISHRTPTGDRNSRSSSRYLRMFGARLNRCLDLGQAAIDEQLDPCYVAAVVRGEEHGGIRDLVRRAHPAHRHGGHDVRLELVELLRRPSGDVDPRRFNRARANGVHADLVVP